MSHTISYGILLHGMTCLRELSRHFPDERVLRRVRSHEAAKRWVGFMRLACAVLPWARTSTVSGGDTEAYEKMMRNRKPIPEVPEDMEELIKTLSYLCSGGLTAQLLEDLIVGIPQAHNSGNAMDWQRGSERIAYVALLLKRAGYDDTPPPTRD